MANTLTSMHTLRTIIELLERKTSQRSIARELSLSRNTVKAYTERIASSGRSLRELQSLEASALAGLLYPVSAAQDTSDRRKARFQSQVSYFLSELKRTGVTRQLLWEEYISREPDGYGYSQFCFHLHQMAALAAPSFHCTYRPAELVMIDFAGDPMYYTDPQSGEQIPCPVLVCVLPYSNYTYVQALVNAKIPSLLEALNNTLHYFKGVPLSLKTDNMKQVVQKSNRYEPSFTELLEQWAQHNRISLLATRVRRPKDKAPVENHVKTIYQRVHAPLRDEVFLSLEALNAAIREQLDQHNDKHFQKDDYSRRDLFIRTEQPLLQQLPDHDFELRHSASAKVQKNYHIVLGEDRTYYSVPWRYIGRQVTVIYDIHTVEIYLGYERIAVHKRAHRKHTYMTEPGHMPEGHRVYREQQGWDGDYFLRQGAVIGTATHDYIAGLLQSRTITEQTYNACRGLLRLAKQYGHQRLEAACERALPSGLFSYKTIENILSHNLDRQQPAAQQDLFRMPDHDNIRGAGAYE